MARGFCTIVDDDCRAPAGFRAPSGVHICKPGYVIDCIDCCQPVCTACSEKEGPNRRVCRDCLHVRQREHKGENQHG